MTTLKQLREDAQIIDEAGKLANFIAGAGMLAAVATALPGNAKDSAAHLAATKAKMQGHSQVQKVDKVKQVKAPTRKAV